MANISLDKLPEDFTHEQFMSLDRESLDKIDYQLFKWHCQCKGCNRGTLVRDYGISPFFMFHRNSISSHKRPEKYWRNLNLVYLLCGKHFKFFERLGKRFETDHIELKMLDYDNTPLQKLVKIKSIKTHV